MLRLMCLAVAACLVAMPTMAQTRRVAVTFDDLPFQTSSESLCDAAHVRGLTENFLAMLAPLDSHATAFVNEGRMCEAIRAQTLPGVLGLWLDAGYGLGNHSFSHINIHQTTAEAYLEDVDQGDDITRPLMEARGQALVWFRHPFLFTGETLEKRSALEAGLAERGYRVAPVTIDNEDWRFGQAYRRAEGEGNPAMQDRIGQAYVRHMAAVLDVVEPYSALLAAGVEPPQVLLLHANSLNQDWYPAIHALFLERGYRFVTLEEAVADPVYRRADGWTRAGGVSWLHRWALAAGVRIHPEPDTPQWVVDYAEGRATAD